MKFKEIASRITGLSVPVFGVQWAPAEPEVAAARRVVAFLENRRVLYAPFLWEQPDHCAQSVIEIRNFLTEELGKLKPTSELLPPLRAMRAACLKFMDHGKAGVLKTGRMSVFGADAWEMGAALGELRGSCGLWLSVLASRYGIDITGALERVLPGKDRARAG